MPMYTVQPRVPSGYQVEVVTDEGSRHTMLGFETEAEAHGWAEEDRKRDSAYRPVLRPN